MYLAFVFALLILFQLKHLIADYFLQTKYHLKKFLPDWDFVLPLLSHSGVHAAFTLVIVLCVRPTLWWLAFVDLVCHFAMDRVKASPHMMGRWKALSANEMKELMDDFKVLNEHYEISFNSRNYFQCQCVCRDIRKINDRIKSNTYFWWCIGIDSCFHHLTDLFIVWMLVR